MKNIGTNLLDSVEGQGSENLVGTDDVWDEYSLRFASKWLRDWPARDLELDSAIPTEYQGIMDRWCRETVLWASGESPILPS